MMSDLCTKTSEPGTWGRSVLRLAATCLLLGVGVFAHANGDRRGDEVLSIGDVGDDTVKAFDASTDEAEAVVNHPGTMSRAEQYAYFHDAALNMPDSLGNYLEDYRAEYPH
jgi:hypothetical protein